MKAHILTKNGRFLNIYFLSKFKILQGINETSPNKKSKILVTQLKILMLVNLFPGSECHKGKGKQSDLISKYSETNIGGNHESNINEDDEFFTLLDFLDDSHDEHVKGDSSSKFCLIIIVIH